jgi:hypothetical protein
MMGSGIVIIACATLGNIHLAKNVYEYTGSNVFALILFIVNQMQILRYMQKGGGLVNE